MGNGHSHSHHPHSYNGHAGSTHNGGTRARRRDSSRDSRDSGEVELVLSREEMETRFSQLVVGFRTARCVI